MMEARFETFEWLSLKHQVLKLECSERAQLKDLLKLFKTIMDLKGLIFLVLRQSTIKTLRLVFFLAMVIREKHGFHFLMGKLGISSA